MDINFQGTRESNTHGDWISGVVQGPWDSSGPETDMLADGPGEMHKGHNLSQDHGQPGARSTLDLDMALHVYHGGDMDQFN